MYHGAEFFKRDKDLSWIFQFIYDLINYAYLYR